MSANSGHRIAMLALLVALAVSAPAKTHAQEGIKVHGHWTIEVRNPDGSIATRRQFENALEPQGGRNLAGLLARTNSGGRWIVQLGGPSASPPCPGAVMIGSPGGCTIAEGGFAPGNGLSQNLTVTLGNTPAGEVVLSGSVTALAASSITEVLTRQAVCAGNITPEACGTGNEFPLAPFSRTVVSPGEPVRQGQIIQVEVRFRFS